MFPKNIQEDIIVAPHTRYELGDEGLKGCLRVAKSIRVSADPLIAVASFKPSAYIYTGYYNQLEQKNTNVPVRKPGRV